MEPIATPNLALSQVVWPDDALAYPIRMPESWAAQFGRASEPVFTFYLPKAAGTAELDERFRRFPDDQYQLLVAAQPTDLVNLPERMRLGLVRAAMLLYLRDPQFIHCFLDNMFNMMRYLFELGADWARFLNKDGYHIFGTDFAYPGQGTPWENVIPSERIGKMLGLNFSHFYRLLLATRLTSDIEILANPPSVPTDYPSAVVNESPDCLPLSARSTLRVHFSPQICIRILPEHLSQGGRISIVE